MEQLEQFFIMFRPTQHKSDAQILQQNVVFWMYRNTGDIGPQLRPPAARTWHWCVFFFLLLSRSLDAAEASVNKGKINAGDQTRAKLTDFRTAVIDWGGRLTPCGRYGIPEA